MRTATNTIDETGNEYGKLTVMHSLPSQNRQAMWRCQCSCGAFCESRGVALRHGDRTSCGHCGVSQDVRRWAYNAPPFTAQECAAALGEEASRVRTPLRNMSKEGYLECDNSGRENVYKRKVEESGHLRLVPRTNGFCVNEYAR